MCREIKGLLILNSNTNSKLHVQLCKATAATIPQHSYICLLCSERTRWHWNSAFHIVAKISVILSFEKDHNYIMLNFCVKAKNTILVWVYLMNLTDKLINLQKYFHYSFSKSNLAYVQVNFKLWEKLILIYFLLSFLASAYEKKRYPNEILIYACFVLRFIFFKLIYSYFINKDFELMIWIKSTYLLAP